MTGVTIVYDEGSQVVEDFHFIEELAASVDPYSFGSPTVRVWWSDPEKDDDDYTDFPGGNVTEVSP